MHGLPTHTVMWFLTHPLFQRVAMQRLDRSLRATRKVRLYELALKANTSVIGVTLSNLCHLKVAHAMCDIAWSAAVLEISLLEITVSVPQAALAERRS